MSDSDIKEAAKEAPPPAPPGLIPPWILRGLKSRRTLKTWIRCTLAFIAAMTLLVDGVTLRNMGQAGFFAAIVAVMLPPFLPLSLYIFLVLTMVIGMLLGWAWGAAAMASALSVRDPALLAQQQKQAQASLVQGIPPAAQMQVFIFHGMFLDPRSSAVYGTFLFIGCYFLGLMRAFLPNLAIAAIFSTIVLDVMCSYGPLFPTAQYTLAKMFLIPAMYYIAIAVASLAIVFPESTNHAWLTTLRESVLIPVRKCLTLQNQMLDTSPEDATEWAKLVETSDGVRKGLLASTQGLLGQAPFVELEVSIGTLGPLDIKQVSKHLTVLVARASGLSALLLTVHGGLLGDTKIQSESKQDRFTLSRARLKEKEQRHKHDLTNLLPILRQASTPLRSKCDDGLQVLTDWLTECNAKRWTTFLKRLDHSRVQQRGDALANALYGIETALTEFKQSERVQLLEPFRPFFHPETGRLPQPLSNNPNHPDMFTARSLFLCFVFADTLVAFSEELIKLLRTAIELDAKRKKPRVWFPSGFGKIARKLAGDSPGDPDPLSMGNNEDLTTFTDKSETDVSASQENLNENDDKEYEKKKKKNCTSPDALPPKSSVGRFFVFLASFFRFLRSAQSIFALRHAVVSLALWIPSVCLTSAWFSYSNKGLWALIMAQTGLAVYAGEQIASFVLRIAGTVVGLLLGMSAWYMGSGHGDGNPYGVVAATTFIVAPLIFVRLVAPPQYIAFWLIAGVTVVFVTGYSWIDNHLVMVSNSGVGVELGWKRALLVMIGFTAGFIVMLFPSPSTSRVFVRKTLAASIDEFSCLLSGELEVFLLEHQSHLPQNENEHDDEEEKRNGNGNEKGMPSSGSTSRTPSLSSRGHLSTRTKRTRHLAMRILDAAKRLQTLAPSLMTAQIEPGLQGRWPKEMYHQLYSIQTSLTFYMALLGTTLTRLDPKWCDVLVHETPFLNPSFLPEVFSTLSIISSSLTTGRPIPGSLPRLVDRLIYHQRMSRYQETQLARNGQLSTSPTARDQSDTEVHLLESEVLSQEGNVDASHAGVHELTIHVLADVQLPVHSTAVIALANIFRLIDECSDVVRSLCGETTFSGFDSLREEFLKREEAAICSENSRFASRKTE